MNTISKFLGRTAAKPLLLLVLLILGLSAIGCGGIDSGAENDGTTNGNDKPKLVMADVSWDSVQVHNLSLIHILLLIRPTCWP